MQNDDSKLSVAADAFEEERRLWSVRKNKATTPAKLEIIRLPDDGGDPEVIMAFTTDLEDAWNEMEALRGIAAMKAALKVMGDEDVLAAVTRAIAEKLIDGFENEDQTLANMRWLGDHNGQDYVGAAQAAIDALLAKKDRPQASRPGPVK